MHRISYWLSATVLATAAITAHSDTQSSTKTVIEHHLAAILGRDLEAIVADYSEHAVLIDPRGVSEGKKAIRAAYGALVANGKPPGPPTQVLYQGEVAFLTWSAPPDNLERQAETLIVRDGKIVAQTVALFSAPAPKP